MDLFQTGTDVTTTVQLVDRSGNQLDVASISYRVVDMNELELVALTPLAGFTSSDPSADVLVPALFNTIAVVPADSLITPNQIDTFNTREARTVELHCTLNGSNNTIIIKSSYGLENPDPLRIGINSFQTLPNAELLAMDISGLSGWTSAASDSDKLAALMTARNRICQLNFWLLNSNTNWGQDNLNYVPEGAYTSNYVTAGAGIFIFNGNLALLTPLQYGQLPDRFKTALKLAQVAEADDLLGGDPVAQMRRSGLMLESIGESKQMFRAGKPIDMPVSKRALRYLSAYVTFTKHMGRA